MKDVPERKADTNSLLSFPQGSFVSGREPAMKTEAVKVETKHQVLLGTNLLHNNVLELVQSVQ